MQEGSKKHICGLFAMSKTLLHPLGDSCEEVSLRTDSKAGNGALPGYCLRYGVQTHSLCCLVQRSTPGNDGKLSNRNYVAANKQCVCKRSLSVKQKHSTAS